MADSNHASFSRLRHAAVTATGSGGKRADAKGGRDLELEGHSLNNIYRRGWRKGMVKAGDPPTVTIAPRKDGAEGGYVVGVKTADGHEF